MKKLLALILILAMVPVVSLASSFELVDLSDEDLALVNQTVQQELFKRSAVQGVTVPAGQYVVGVDIPAGTYRVVLPNNDQYPVCSFSSTFNNEENPNTFGPYILSMENNTVGRLDLTDKQVIRLDYPLIFYTYTGLFH